MGKSCSFIPCNKQGEELKGFQEYKDNLGYKLAADVFPQVLSPSFQDEYKNKLVKDDQGVPTYKSAVTTKHIQDFIGAARLSTTKQKNYPEVENTRDNYKRLLQDAYNFNKNSGLNDTLTAVVTMTDNGKLKVEIRPKNNANEKEFKDQYSTHMLNERLVEMFGRVGITIELLEGHETVDGKVDFGKASDIANGFKGLISIANNMQGEIALTEEFSHLLIGMFRSHPLIQRSLRILEENDNQLREVLGDEYESNRKYYESNPNYDSFGNRMSVESSLAEEALGRILQGNLTGNRNTEQSSTLSRLIRRIVDFIKSIFKGNDVQDIDRALIEVDTSMGELAKDILNGTLEISKEKVMNAGRKAMFNHLKEGVDRILQTLRNANEVERKRYKIAPDDMKKDIKTKISELESLILDGKKMEAVHKYANCAIKDLEDAMSQLDAVGVDDFTALKNIKMVLDSYSEFISDFHEILQDITKELTPVEGSDDETVNAANALIEEYKNLWRDLDDLYKSCTTTFKERAFEAFSNFLEPIYNKAPLKNEDGTIKPLRDVLVAEEFDISEFDRWVVSMGNSSSIILQLFDKAVKNTKDDIRRLTKNDVRKVWKIRDDAAKRGIRSFDWIFERDNNGHKTGYYISPYNRGQYEKDKKAMLTDLVEKYGKNPIGENYNRMVAEKKAWFAAHSEFDMFGNDIPNDTYRNSAFDRLTEDQKAIRNDILAFKRDIEGRLPKDRRDVMRAVQRRRSGTQRIIDTLANSKNAEDVYESVSESLRSTFTRTEDDDQLYGERTQGLTDFTGKEYLTLPILYTHMLKNPDELSDDVMGDLMVYAHMSNSYCGMSQIVDPLSIGADLMTNMENKFVKGRGSKVKEEVLNVLGRVSRKTVKAGTNTAFARKLYDYLECQVYGKYLKEDDVVGPNAQKFVSWFSKLTSTAYLGFNFLQGVANVATAVGMQNIEAFAGEFFGKKELAKADWKYKSLIVPFIAELGSVSKQSELALFDELFDVKQDYRTKLHNNQLYNVIRKFFGNNWAFIQQAMGDHWVYNRTAIAMAMKRQVIVDGKQMSVWDAREIVTDANGYKMMKIKDGAMNLDGTRFDVGAFSREIAHINHTLMGIYNDDDMNAANRVTIGRVLQQMRKWIVPQMMRRFQSKRTILDIGKEEEGYYRTTWRFAVDVWKSGFKIGAEWDKLKENPEEFANVKRGLTEMAQTYALWLIMWALGSGVKDPDRCWALKFAEYLLHREIHELGFLTPGPMMATEGLKTVQSPAVVVSSAAKFAQAILTTMWPGNWFPDDSELIKSGRYEGHSYIYKRWAELPLPVISWVRQVDKFTEGIDDATKFYSKDYK